MIAQLQDIMMLIYEAYPNLSGLAKAYVEGLDKMITLFTNTVEEIIQRQCTKIYLHLEPEPDNEQQQIIKQKILDISQGKTPREALYNDSVDMFTEEEASEIMVNFENATFHKIENGQKITLDDYINFARKHGYSIGKVLVASAWLDVYLSKKAIEARNTACQVPRPEGRGL